MLSARVECRHGAVDAVSRDSLFARINAVVVQIAAPSFQTSSAIDRFRIVPQFSNGTAIPSSRLIDVLSKTNVG